MTSFNGVLQSSTFDHGAAELQRQHAYRLATLARWARTEQWIRERTQGQRFYSLESLVAVAQRTYETTIGGPAKIEHLELIESACRNLWSGFSAPGTTDIKLNESGRVESIYIRAA